MLRISEKKEGERIKVLYLEGKLRQDNVRQLQMEIDKGKNTGESVILDFAKVVFLDDEAAQLIRKLIDSRLRLRNCSLFIRTALRIEEKKEGEKN
jgi:anti-anti-sigma regulatory factor